MDFVWKILEELPDGYDGKVPLQRLSASQALGFLYVTRSAQIMGGPWPWLRR